MLALKITDIRDFTNKLFIGEVFDKFCLSEAVITTFNTFTIDGRLQKDFFDTDSLNKITEHGHVCVSGTYGRKSGLCTAEGGEFLNVQMNEVKK